ncbi:MAG: tRNA pseudouridine(38-40) synthase TruA [Bacteroidales bacterium]|jgi:tRNA pseudouridine38-40 synthase|nr:tRNA pseudouridine(38-40) synthase TruA [Bacteroidales bacterium]MDD4058073.1 tRNA pseudouridine(38-40) synthase TruA [Bacteroidales bacterium]
MRLFIKLSYNGRNYNGWQIQPREPSVQAELERALTIWFKESVEITGAGRTDSGVHAINYIAHFDLASVNMTLIEDMQNSVFKINAILPSDIVVHKIWQVPDNAHARFDAISRTYNYYVHSNKAPFLNEYSYFYPYTLNIEKMNRACSLILGTLDFTSMAKLHTDAKTNICTVTNAIWEAKPQMLTGENISYKFTVTANRFLRNMVRALVGTMLEIGRERREPEWIIEVLNLKDRSSAGNSVPAHPLFLTDIEYPEYKL